jgi:hypothetical protein
MKQENQPITSTLAQIQKDFYEGVLNRENTAIIQHIHHHQSTPEFRFSVYRHSILQNLRHALEAIFPAIWLLVGKECADSLVFAFAKNKNNLPVTPCLNDWGKRFPAFLQNIKALEHLVYLKDIATIEWLKHSSYCATNYRVLSPLDVQKCLDCHLECLRLKFNPTVFFYSSPYSLKPIFDFLENSHETDFVDLQMIPCYVVITRQRHQVFTHWVSQDMFDFFKVIKKHSTLLPAYESVLRRYPNFNLSYALHFMLKYELLWKCTC